MDVSPLTMGGIGYNAFDMLLAAYLDDGKQPQEAALLLASPCMLVLWLRALLFASPWMLFLLLPVPLLASPRMLAGGNLALCSPCFPMDLLLDPPVDLLLDQPAGVFCCPRHCLHPHGCLRAAILLFVYLSFAAALCLPPFICCSLERLLLLFVLWCVVGSS